MSKVALQNGASSDVKAFAQRMVEEHEKAGKELEMISAKLGAAPSKSAGKQSDLTRLAELKGAKLDGVYVERMVNGHKGAIAGGDCAVREAGRKRQRGRAQAFRRQGFARAQGPSEGGACACREKN